MEIGNNHRNNHTEKYLKTMIVDIGKMSIIYYTFAKMLFSTHKKINESTYLFKLYDIYNKYHTYVY